MIINNKFTKKQSGISKTAVKYGCDGNVEEVKRQLLSEHRTNIFIGSHLAMTVVCTADMLVELAVGRLISERLIESVSDIEYLYVCESGGRITVILNKNTAVSAAVSETLSCCSDNKIYFNGSTEFRRIEKVKTDKAEIFKIISAAAEDTALHKSTSGTHSCILAANGKMLSSFEDIGRHNALDKAVGYMYLNNILPSESAVYLTGRIPIDMVRKCIAAKIPLVITKSVPTSEAVEMAEKYGITLVCRAWPDSFEIYT